MIHKTEISMEFFLEFVMRDTQGFPRAIEPRMVQIQDRAISSCLAIIILQHATEAIAVLNDSIAERDDIRASVTEPLAENAIFLVVPEIPYVRV